MLTGLIFGGSAAHGTGSPNSSWAGKIQLDVENAPEGTAGDDLVYNLGILGETSTQLAQRCQDEARRRFRERDTARFVIVHVPGNDTAFTMDLDTHAVEPDKTASNVAAIIDINRSFGAVTFVHNILPVNELVTVGTKRRKTNGDIAEYNRQLKSVCELAEQAHPGSAIYIDVAAAFLAAEDHVALLCADGVHPNTQGHELIYQLISAVLSRYVPEALLSK